MFPLSFLRVLAFRRRFYFDVNRTPLASRILFLVGMARNSEKAQCTWLCLRLVLHRLRSIASCTPSVTPHCSPRSCMPSAAMLNKFLQMKKDAAKGPVQQRPFIASEVL